MIEHVERKWGFYEVLDHREVITGHEVTTKYLEIQAGENISYQKHQHRSEEWVIIEGHGYFVSNGRFDFVDAGMSISIPAGNWHAIKAVATLKIMEIQLGEETREDDIERKYIEWEEMIEALDLPSYTGNQLKSYP